MKVKYNPQSSVSKEWAEFDPGCEPICPKCGVVEPVPFNWKPQQIHICTKPDIKSWNKICNTAMFDIRSLLGDDLEFVVRLCELGQLNKANMEEWYRKSVLWHCMYTCESVPKWKVEPFPLRR